MVPHEINRELYCVKGKWMDKVRVLIFLFTLFCIESKAQTVTDIDGNIYNTVVIGSQTWMAENLKTTRFNNGDPILTSPALLPQKNPICQWVYRQDSRNLETYGRLYTWYVTSSTRNVCPVGWHVPTDKEWEVLWDYLGGKPVAGGKLKESGVAHWIGTDSTVTNSIGFSGLPGGMRAYGQFTLLGEFAAFWGADSYSVDKGHFYYINTSFNFLGASATYKNNGVSIRCVKD